MLCWPSIFSCAIVVMPSILHTLEIICKLLTVMLSVLLNLELSSLKYCVTACFILSLTLSFEYPEPKLTLIFMVSFLALAPTTFTLWPIGATPLPQPVLSAGSSFSFTELQSSLDGTPLLLSSIITFTVPPPSYALIALACPTPLIAFAQFM